eukprot:SAG31_NODE_7875_length_1576_cov_1.593771_2_plen_102_part_00
MHDGTQSLFFMYKQKVSAGLCSGISLGWDAAKGPTKKSPSSSAVTKDGLTSPRTVDSGMASARAEAAVFNLWSLPIGTAVTGVHDDDSLGLNAGVVQPSCS